MANKKSGKSRGRLSGNIMVVIMLAVLILAVIYFSPRLREYLGIDNATPDTQTPMVNGSLMEMHVIDVGQGDSILVRTSGGDMLIDSGPGSAGDQLKEYLTSVEVKDIEYAVFTHPDADHIGNADMIMTDYTVSNVILPDKEATSKTYQRMMTAIGASGAKVISPEPDMQFSLGEMTVTILAPISSKYTDTNNYSVVMRLDFGETSFMMTGDAEEKSEQEMLTRYGAKTLDCDVLKVGHHGSTTSTCLDFLKAVSPAIALISCGEGNTYGHPNAETLQKLEALSVPIYRTDEVGSIILTSDGKDITVTTTSGTK
ncbi:MAG: ComEC/Rec2 family competence protein [Eubacteriales bacterium]|nr:ComEC/Rec2 family competence protein [Eubacteriales bacterium]